MNPRRRAADQHHEAGNSDECESHDEWASLSNFVRSQTSTDGTEASKSVDWDSHQLGLVCGVAELVDDGGEEERDGVERREAADGDKHGDPDLPISERLDGIFEVKIVREAAIIKHSSLNFCLFFGREELGTEKC